VLTIVIALHTEIDLTICATLLKTVDALVSLTPDWSVGMGHAFVAVNVGVLDVALTAGFSRTRTRTSALVVKTLTMRAVLSATALAVRVSGTTKHAGTVTTGKSLTVDAVVAFG